MALYGEIQRLKLELEKWQERARMAHKQGDRELVRSALKQKRHFKKLLDNLNKESEDPPERLKVPLKRPPGVGAGEVSLPLPKPEETE